MYADTITDSMRAALDETQRRREVQMAYNEEHGITPKTIQKAVRDLIAVSKKVAASEVQMEKDPESTAYPARSRYVPVYRYPNAGNARGFPVLSYSQ